MKTALDYFNEADKTDCGIELHFTNNEDADLFRKRLYAARKALKEDEGMDYSHLGFLLDANRVQIVRKNFDEND